MFKKKVSKVLALSLSLLLTLGMVMPVSAAGDGSLVPYEQKLDALNKELGTNYKMEPESGQTMADLAEFYSTMSIEEFESYIRNAHKAEKVSEKRTPFITFEIVRSGGAKAAIITTKQKYYYDGGPHYVGLEAKIDNSGGVWFYDSYVNYIYSGGSPYPYLQPVSMSYSFSSNRRNASCSYKCKRYIANGVVDAAYRNVSCTFTAGAGDVYPGA